MVSMTMSMNSEKNWTFMLLVDFGENISNKFCQCDLLCRFFGDNDDYFGAVIALQWVCDVPTLENAIYPHASAFL